MKRDPENEQENYVEHQIEEVQKGRFAKHKDIAKAENGSMVNDLEDMKILGDDMNEMNTNEEDEQKGLRPDPEQ
ncbi:hypothetical protein DCC85_18600 [Paenibacillus sp. CAA11]|uniref:hypothetical protein n=1 Tax=Paenibacillus sp. CAA11 TaxID=1532905 RepID=UPI000D3B2DFB|nr:hypothetical protein [Paenibacillus sp. CAA11]AWB45981.1 hypothetical protein DCC85_18600 [Paenibacillus sp. CAA11]